MSDISDQIYKHRKDFEDGPLSREDMLKDPRAQFEHWLQEALALSLNEAYAMCLSTNGEDGYPSNRIVYLRGITETGLIFYTNYLSMKGKEIAADHKASLNFFWAELHRQVRVKGDVVKVDEARSDAYFASRPRESQLGAWASSQSSPLESRESLQARIAELEKDYEGKEIPRPEHWGGYILKPMEWEFWKGRSSRLHDRFRYVQESGNWKIFRLYP